MQPRVCEQLDKPMECLLSPQEYLEWLWKDQYGGSWDDRCRKLLAGWSNTPNEIDLGLVLTTTWFTCILGLWGQFTAICHGPQQYRHRRFARLRWSSSSDNGPRRRVVLISIGVGVLFSGDRLYESFGKGFATTWNLDFSFWTSFEKPIIASHHSTDCLRERLRFFRES